MGCLVILTPWRGSRKPILMVLCGAWGSGAPQWSSSEQLPEEWDLLVCGSLVPSDSFPRAKSRPACRARVHGSHRRLWSPRVNSTARTSAVLSLWALNDPSTGVT